MEPHVFNALQTTFFHQVNQHSSDDDCFSVIRLAWYLYKDAQINPLMSLLEFAQVAVAMSLNLNHLQGDFPENFHAFIARDNATLRCGAVMFSPNRKYVLLANGFSRLGNYTFPKGKRKATESRKRAAIREVLEETGIDITNFITNLQVNVTEDGHQSIFFIADNVPLVYDFGPKERREIRNFPVGSALTTAYHASASLDSSVRPSSTAACPTATTSSATTTSSAATI